jgi:transcriptional regulator with XRE-family HTH domain
MTNGSQPEPPLTASVGEWLRWALPRYGYDPAERGTRARFAEASGIPAATVSRLLGDTGQPDIRTLLAVGQTLNVPVLPLIARAGLLPPEEIAADKKKARRPASPHEALEALGVTDTADQAAVLSMIRALHAKDAGESAP